MTALLRIAMQLASYFVFNYEGQVEGHTSRSLLKLLDHSYSSFSEDGLPVISHRDLYFLV
jgi:hypothetical protein